ncbi:Rpn family recombination-promoting nuclease/putative transposase [Heliophilum fasciatum]|uniref:Rpn family recombination-promoting nuclease/putative transposase n=1 Tax=Heliophilum fasciatum TaxID=35700 RepID=UPI001A9BAC3C|nr:Rpn family recombination-promoting nuclease/putative transposase [Heliophilum fasciatum]MCW2277321.1 hypothetical protein [Heliophilum fasciatum]
MHVPLIDVKDQTMDVVFALEDDSLLHLEFESSEPTIADQIRYGHYDLELFAQQQKIIRRIVIFAAGIQKTPEPLNIGSLTTHQNVIHLSRHFDGADELERALIKIQRHEPLDAQDKLRIMLLPMMFEKPQERSQAAWKITEALQQEHSDNSAYLIGTMAAANFSNLLSPEKEKIMEVLQMANAFQELYREFEEKGIEKGFKKGIEKGIEKGRKEGIEEGREKGREEVRKEIAITALNNKFDVETVAKLSHLPLEKVLEIKKELGL